eukprot:PhM_4_TR5448/c0_g1_i1/m.77757/K05016/CLCN7; chloride channel 7
MSFSVINHQPNSAPSGGEYGTGLARGLLSSSDVDGDGPHSFPDRDIQRIRGSSIPTFVSTRQNDEAWFQDYSDDRDDKSGGDKPETVSIPIRRPHHFTRHEAQHMAKYESIDYWEPESEVFKAHLAKRRSEHRWLKWFVYAAIGGVVGAWAFLLISTSAWLGKKREAILDMYSDKPGLAWFLLVLLSSSLALGSSIVCLVMPAAAGSGVPDVMAYLNGVMFPKIFNFRSLFAKTMSCLCAVASGLPLGVEGPMIHLGALIGAAIPTGRSRTLGCSANFLATFRNSKDHRDFIAAGAAAGVAAAFRAPVGGLLFVMEEVASFFPVKIAWMTFFCCLCSVFTIDMLTSYSSAWKRTNRADVPSGELLREASVLFDITSAVAANVWGFIPSLVIGVVCGFLAVGFTVFNIAILRMRSKFISPHPRRKVCEAAVVAAVFASLLFLFARTLSCTKPNAAIEAVIKSSHLPISHLQCEGNSYNAFASLSIAPADDSLRLLFSRQTYELLTYDVLCVHLFLYIVFACYSGGMFLAGGMMIPSLMIGALAGRIIGRATYFIIDLHHPDQLKTADGTPPWADPGLFALIGASAFMGGLSRLTFSLTVVMLELSGDLHQILHIALSILIAKTVADKFTHSLYHGILDVKCVPFLDWDSQVHKLDVFDAGDLIQPDVVTLQEVVPLRNVVSVLTSTTHNAFPVTTQGARTFKGLILRSQLELVLWYAKPDGGEVVETRRHSTFSELKALRERNFWGRVDGIPDFTEKEGGLMLDLRPYYDSSAFSVMSTSSISRTYYLVRSLGLRHLVVVNENNEVVGVLTRKDLVAGNLEARLTERAATHVTAPRGDALFAGRENDLHHN